LAVLGRVLLNSAERIDLPDLLSIDSYGAGDWKYFMQTLVGTTKPYILSGFDVIDPGTAIGLPTCSFRVADSVVYYPGSAAGPFFYGLPEGNSAAEPLVPQLRTSATNYVYLTLSTFETSVDARALWDPDRNGGEGGEFTQEINTESVIQAQLGISTGSFPVNTVPLAIIVVGPTAISSITDVRDMMFRLGTGGIAHDPHADFAWPALPDSSYKRVETNETMTLLSDPNPFQGGDKNITTLKQWMDAVMTKLKELGGTAYWYEDTTTFSLVKLFHDALATAWKSKGSYTHSSATPGELSWSEDLYVKSMNSPIDVVIRASGGSPITLANEQVAFLNLVRDQPVNSLDEPVSFSTGTVTIGLVPYGFINTSTGATGQFALLKKGDWIKKASDSSTLYVQVRDFYNAAQSPGPVTGSPTSEGAARSIIVSAPYAGTPSPVGGDRAVYEQGEYDSSDIQIVDRNNNLLTAAAGNMMWFAQRSDTIMNIASISAVTVSGTLTVANGDNATVSATAHGLVDGDRIRVTAPGAQAGTYTVDIVDANTFTFKTTNTTTGAFTGYYGLCTTQTRSVFSFQLESANHGFDSGESIIVAGTTNFNDDYIINVRSGTQFQFPLSTSFATETTGTATLARMDVRSEEGIQKIVQGETIDVGSGTVDNMQQFIGMTAVDQTYPVYTLPGGYNTLNGGANFNSLVTDNLTTRVSKNTAMLMDKAQDKTIKYLTNAVSAFVEDGGGGLQNLSFTPTNSTLTILQPGGAGNAVVNLPNLGSPVQLSVNQSVYVTIDRNASSTPGLVYATTSTVPVNENVFVIASRLSGSEVYLWNGECILGTVPIANVDNPVVPCDYFDPLSTTLPTGNPVTIDNVNIVAGETVVFNNLTVGSHRMYQANGVGTNITGWNVLYKFNGWLDPDNADMILVKKGQGFSWQVGHFRGDQVQWVFNDYVRYFNGADYMEQSAFYSATVTDNATTTIFTLAWAGSEHILVDYSIVRGTARETGTMRIVTDGAGAEVSTDSSYINGNSGVTFAATVSGANLILSGTATSTGTNAQLKYSIRRWSSSFPGGPGGVPNYSGAAPVPTPAAAPVGAIQFNSGGVLAGNSNFKIDTVDISMDFNGLRQGVLSSGVTILDNQSSAVNLVLLSGSYSHYVLEYSVEKETFKRTGELRIAYDGTNVVCNDSYVETGATGVVLSAIVSGGIQLQYTSTNGAGDGTFKYSWRKWN
jgi:hypothetical protein